MKGYMKSGTSSCIYCLPLVLGGMFLTASFLLSFVWLGGVTISAVVEWEFFGACGFSMVVLVLIDFVSLLFSSVVCFIGGCVFIFSASYMEGDKFSGLFCCLVSVFVMAMNTLIFTPNLVFVLLGWDILGIVSFLLVIYYQSSYSIGAGMLTVLVNRIGDVFLVLSIGLGSEAGFWGELLDGQLLGNLSMVVVLLVGASMTKSAQIPFSAWLPAAMAAPTPVSALVHSSTLVTVGVYFLFRHYSLLVSMDGLLSLLSKVGCITLLMSGLGACFEFDVKKMIALSTLSHLGFMVYMLGVGYPMMGLFHLLSHALFKSLLFLCAGSYIHNALSCQDIRQMSGIGWGSSPNLVACTVVGCNSLCGAPFLSGFYSKDVILEASISSCVGILEVFSLVLSAAASCFYCMRLLSRSILGPFGGFGLVSGCQDSGFVGVPIFMLAVGGIGFGYAMQQVWVSACEVFWVSFEVKMWLLLVLNLGNFVLWADGANHGYCFWLGFGSLVKWFKAFMVFFGGMWFLRWFHGPLFGPWFVGSALIVSVMEMGWVEVIGGFGVGTIFTKFGVKLWVFEGLNMLHMLRFVVLFLLVLVLWWL
uniref:NADH-ubiquinone oxidoreductase chain 5 n=1 Tax=Monodontina vondembuschiana TaxID=2508272 RepID=A0A513X0G5_9BIVA|nr:NADH dehydrogenase subunit 5 [Monodontina vondembuschiana]